MFRKTRFFTLLTCFAFVTLAQAQSVDDIIKKHIKASGGLEKLKSVKSMTITGTSSIPAMGVEATFTRKSMRPNLLRLDVDLQGQKMVQAFDGEKAWHIFPFTGSTATQAMPEAQAKAFRLQTDMDGPLIDYKSKGHKVELVGKEALGEREAYHLKVTMKSGEDIHIYLDSESYLQVKATAMTPGPGGNEIKVETMFSDYKEVDGMMMAHTMTQNNPMQGKVEIKMTSAEINPKLDTAIFKMPTK